MNTVAGINLTQNMTDPEFLQVFSHCADSVDNCLEDGYVEREISLMCPGTGKDALAVMNMVLYETSEYLENDDPNNPKKNVPGRDFLDVLHQVLLYCEFGEIKIADDYNGALSDFIYDCIEVVDDYKLERDPVKRCEGVNELLCIMAPLIDKAIQEQKQQNQNQQGQQQEYSKDKLAAQVLLAVHPATVPETVLAMALDSRLRQTKFVRQSLRLSVQSVLRAKMKAALLRR